MEQVYGILCTGLAAIFAVALLVVIASNFLFICAPNEILVFSGRRKRLEDGSQVGYRVLFGGHGWRVPLLERVERMDLRNIPIDIRVINAYSKGGIPLKVHAIANVKVSGDPRVIGNAIERFLGRDPAEIRRVAKETLEGHLRGVLATLTPEEVNEDRLKFAAALMSEAGEDLAKLGLQLDTLKIQSVSDDAKYLASIGRGRIALVQRNAEVAESTAKADAEQAEATAKQQAQVAVEQAEANILEKQNAVQQAQASLEAKARSEEARTEQAPLEARAQAEQKLQEIRGRLEQLRLQADVVLPAQAAQRAESLRAQGRAASIAENGEALAQALRLMTDAWKKAGPDARDIFLIQNLEQVLGTVVERVNSVEIGHVKLLDGGGGEALARYAASWPAMVSAVLQELKNSTGVDVIGALSPESQEVTR